MSASLILHAEKDGGPATTASTSGRRAASDDAAPVSPVRDGGLPPRDANPFHLRSRTGSRSLRPPKSRTSVVVVVVVTRLAGPTRPGNSDPTDTHFRLPPSGYLAAVPIG